MSALSPPRQARALRQAPSRRTWPTPPAWLLAAAFALAYAIVAPISSDLAAAGYRSELVSRAGITLWDNGWYGGHHLLAYSVLAPALGALLDPQVLAGASAVLATALFGVLVEREFAPPAARVATLWFALGASVTLLANRVPFELGLALALAALVIAQRATARPTAERADAPASLLGRGERVGRRELVGRRERIGRRERLGRGTRRGDRHATAAAVAVALAALSALASPVAGAFLALAALAWALSGTARALASALTLAALAPVALLELAFPEGGTQPFVASAFYPALAAVLALAALLPARERVLRAGALLYALAMIGAYAIPSAVGGNADRLGSLVAGPLLACALIGGDRSAGSRGMTRAARSRAARRWRTWALVALAPLLLYWQLRAPIADYVSAAGDAAAKRSFYAPLLGELRRLGIGYEGGAARIEVVPSRDHAEARWVAARIALARGWERQLDTSRGALFYTGATRLNASAYATWLRDNAVSYVALSDAPPDYSARAEARLVRAAPSYLREVYRSRHWRLFAVVATTPLAQPPGALTQLGADSFALRAPRSGSYLVRVRFTPYWALASGRGCVRRAPGGWTTVQTRRAGTVRVAVAFSLSRVLDDGPRCR